jgi:CRISPR-associated protein (TIGR02710 family)
MAGALVISVGGSPQPVIFSLRCHEPQFVCFLASQRSIDLIGDVKAAIGRALRDEKVLVDEPDDLVGCYEKAVECLTRTERAGFDADATVVDYTGGTKAMTAALAMAAVSRGVRFSYVGGERDLDGLGRVVSGGERLRLNVGPWQLFAVEEKRRIAQYFNGRQYAAAALSIRDLLPRARPSERLFLEPLLVITEGYGAWDRFDHRTAIRSLERGRGVLAERVSATGRANAEPFLEVVGDNLALLRSMEAATQNFARPDQHLAGDLIANADRRIDEGKFDDAVARLYRALELWGQIAFEHAVGTPNASVPVGRLPPSLREEYALRYRRAEGTVALPLTATFRVLAELGDDVGSRFLAQESNLKKILDARNHSILAHGLRPITREQAARFRKIVTEFLPADLPIPRFPRLPWDGGG